MRLPGRRSPVAITWIFVVLTISFVELLPDRDECDRTKLANHDRSSIAELRILHPAIRYSATGRILSLSLGIAFWYLVVVYL